MGGGAEFGRVTSRIWLDKEEKRDQIAGPREGLDPRPRGRRVGRPWG